MVGDELTLEVVCGLEDGIVAHGLIELVTHLDNRFGCFTQLGD
jgi:hypothetical protein